MRNSIWRSKLPSPACLTFCFSRSTERGGLKFSVIRLSYCQLKHSTSTKQATLLILEPNSVSIASVKFKIGIELRKPRQEHFNIPGVLNLLALSRNPCFTLDATVIH